MRPKREYRSASKENYLLFKKDNPGVDISFAKWVEVIRTWNELFVEQLILTGEPGKIPFGLGRPSVRKYRPTTKKKDKDGKEIIKRPINWPATKELGKYVYYLNFHTDGWQYFFQWRHQDCKLRCALIWKFEIARVHRRRLGALLKTPNDPHKDLYREAEKRF